MPSVYAQTVLDDRYAHTLPDGSKESWDQIARRVAVSVLSSVEASASLLVAVEKAIQEKKFMPGGRYLYASGRPYHQVQNCLLLRAEDSREGWGDLVQKCTLALMTGAGIGIEYSDLRGEGSLLGRSGGESSGPVALMEMVNALGRGARQGGSRRGAIWAGLRWDHPDIFKFIHAKDWPLNIQLLKQDDPNFPAPLDFTNISVGLNTEFFDAYEVLAHPKHDLAHKVYWETVRQACTTGDPGFAIDAWENEEENLRNACTEITSCDDSDICNLGSINLARVESLEEMKKLVEIGTIFLLAGTVYSDVPYPRVARIRAKNRRLGLGLMGIHEFLLKRGKRYGPDTELSEYLQEYRHSGYWADLYADRWGLTRPVKTRAIAPTGTIGSVAETTTGIEPIFALAYLRRFRRGIDSWSTECLIDPTAKRLLAQGVDRELLEDAYSISPERRIDFQAWVQSYVDHGISSTVNLPAWGSAQNNEETLRSFGETLMTYLPGLRGITAYPDGARSGQPLQSIPLEEALKLDSSEASIDVCDLRGGSCGA